MYPQQRVAKTSSTSTEPLTLAQAKAHLRVEHAVEDAFITALIVAARDYCERLSGRSLIPHTFLLTLDRFPSYGQDIVLAHGPVTAVTSINYYASDLTDTLMVVSTDYRTALQFMPARIRLPLASTVWPDTARADDAVRIVYTGGGSAPTSATQAMLLLIGHWYENRESVVTGTVSTELQITVRSLLDAVRTGDRM